LTANDPELRPCDCALFKKNWRANCLHSKELQLPCEDIAAAVEEYTARMLLTGARELQGKGKSEDAYALLTESLDIWPDNSDALDYLQNKFSTPIRNTRRRRTVLVTAATFAIILAVVTAYFFGTQSSGSPDVIGKLSIQQDETRYISLLRSSKNFQSSQSPSVALRETGGGMNLTGTINVIGSCGKGSLFIDGNPVTEWKNGGVSILLKVGTHRIEWLDSTSQRRFGEIVEVLPFEKKNSHIEKVY
jgi:hypothetical protein